MIVSSEAQYGNIVPADWVPEADSQPWLLASLDVSKLLTGISWHYQKTQQDKINFINLHFQVLSRTEHCETRRVITGFHNS